LWDIEASTFSLDNRFTDDGEAVILPRRTPFTPRKIPGTHFCQRPSRPQDHSEAERIRSMKNPVILSGIEPAIFRLIASTNCLPPVTLVSEYYVLGVGT
jgi:hypothetical protein